MATYGTTVHLNRPFNDAVEAARAALAEQGFGVLTEIDIRATMKAKLDVDVPNQVILGACNPPFAHRALEIEPSIGLLLPCNIVVRDTAEGTVVEAIDPAVLVAFTGNDALAPLAAELRLALQAAMRALQESPVSVAGIGSVADV